MHERVPIRRVLVAVDFSDAAREAFHAGIGLANELGAEVCVLHVAVPIRSFDFTEKRYVETAETIDRVEEGVRRRLDELFAEGGFDATVRARVNLIVRGADHVEEEILATAKDEDVDLIVIGSSTDGGSDSALGGTVELIARDAHCSVLCVRGRPDEP